MLKKDIFHQSTLMHNSIVICVFVLERLFLHVEMMYTVFYNIILFSASSFCLISLERNR